MHRRSTAHHNLPQRGLEGEHTMTMTRGQHLIGKVLGSCTLERLLGYGGSSAVFLAQQHDPDRKVAVKVFLPRSNMDRKMQRDFYTRFLHEAEAASHLNHPNILPIYSYGEQDRLPYIVMPYMVGGTLSEYVAKHGPFTIQESCWYLDQLASALDYAHQHGCVHCDVKPANILIDGSGRVVLSDFGIAHMMKTENAAEQGPIKSPDAMMGTPDYISPEQALGESLDGRSDVYSLGITLFYMLAKQLPFRAESAIALALMHVHDRPPALALLRLDVTPDIDRVVQKALAKHPDDRFQTAGEFSRAFSSAVKTAESFAYVDISSPSGKRNVLTTATVMQSEPQPIHFVSKPIVQVRPVKKRSHILSRVMIVATLLLAIVTVGAFATNTISLHPFSFNKNVSASTDTTSVLHPKVVDTDLLANNEGWPISSTYFYTAPRQYHVRNTSPNNVALALYTEHQYSNFHLTITLQEIQSARDGADYYGVVFRSTSDQSRYYLFEIVTAGTGQYVFWRYDGQWKTIAAGPAPALYTNAQKSNTLDVVARNNTFTFAVNKQAISGPITDPLQPNLTSGAVGLYVEDKGAEVVFSHLYVNVI